MRFADFIDLDNQKAKDNDEVIDLYGTEGDLYREQVAGSNIGFKTEKGTRAFVKRIPLTIHIKEGANKNQSNDVLGTFMSNEYVGATPYRDVRQCDFIIAGAISYAVTQVDNAEKNVSYLQLVIQQ